MSQEGLLLSTKWQRKSRSACPMYTGTTSTLLILKTHPRVPLPYTAITRSLPSQNIPTVMSSRWYEIMWRKTTLKDYTDWTLMVYVYVINCSFMYSTNILILEKNIWLLISLKTCNFHQWIYSEISSVWRKKNQRVSRPVRAGNCLLFFHTKVFEACSILL